MPQQRLLDEFRNVIEETFKPYPWRQYLITDRKQVVREIFAGFSVALTLVGEGIAFAFILNVEPQLALHASWIVGLITATLGSRLAMINGADGVRAAALGPFILEHGVEYLFPVVLCMSALFLLAAVLNLMRFVRMIPVTVMTGFVNGLALIIFIGQIDHFKDKQTHGYVEGPTLYWMLFEVFLTVLVSLALPRIPRIGPVLPAALLAIGVCTLFDYFVLRMSTDWSTPTIGTVSNITNGPPTPFWLDSKYADKLPPCNWDTFTLIIGPSITTAGACFVETVMTIEVVDDLTKTTTTRPRQQMIAMSLANLVAGLAGTMGGAALIPETVFNIVVAGANGRYRISAMVAAIVVLIFVMVAQEFIRNIPTASIVGVMLIVVFHTFDWSSIPIVVSSFVPEQVRRHLPILRTRKVNRFDALVIVVVTVVVVLTNLFIAVLAGVLLTSAAVVWNSGERLLITSMQTIQDDDQGLSSKTYIVHGPLLFSASKRFIKAFDPGNDPPIVEVVILGPGVLLQDFSAIHALNVVGKKYEDLGKVLVVKDLDEISLKRLAKADTLRKHFKVVVAPEGNGGRNTTIENDTSREDDSRDDEISLVESGRASLTNDLAGQKNVGMDQLAIATSTPVKVYGDEDHAIELQ